MALRHQAHYMKSCVGLADALQVPGWTGSPPTSSGPPYHPMSELCSGMSTEQYVLLAHLCAADTPSVTCCLHTLAAAQTAVPVYAQSTLSCIHPLHAPALALDAHRWGAKYVGRCSGDDSLKLLPSRFCQPCRGASAMSTMFGLPGPLLLWTMFVGYVVCSHTSESQVQAGLLHAE
jgi:hypothetical protein